MAYHYAFMMKMMIVREPEMFSEATKDPRWVEVTNEEMQEISKNETWDLFPSPKGHWMLVEIQGAP